MAKTINFSAEVEDFLYETMARAINRAIENGTYVHIPIEDESLENKEEADQSLAG